MVLTRPGQDDVDELFTLFSDPRVWTHLPSAVVRERAETVRQVSRWEQEWIDSGLGAWVVRDPDDARLLGYAGCSLRGGPDPASRFWNLGYRFQPEEQGRGLATEAARVAVDAAHSVKLDVPVVAYLLEHNLASAAVARKLGLTQRWRGPDAGNPDPQAIRLVFADRSLTPAQLDATCG
jgi:RimJ/RimL family protein N-acetyltransferase